MLWRVRDILEVIAPALQVGGLCSTSDVKKALDAYNRINEIMMMRDDWPGTEVDVSFTVCRGVLTLPSQFGQITALRINGNASRILPMGYEYLEAGPGRIEYNTDASVLQDLGNRFCTYADLTYPMELFCYSDAVEVAGSNLRIYGQGENGAEIRIQGVPGLAIGIAKSSPETAPQSTGVKFKSISALVKTVTAGYVDVLGIDEQTKELRWLTRLSPHETAPSLSRYMLPSANKDLAISVDARVSLQFTPLYALDDISLIQHREPYRLMAQAILAFDAENGALGSQYQERAMAMIKGAVSKKTKGQHQTLKVSMSRRPTRNGRFYSIR